MKLIKFTSFDDQKDIWINPEHVVCAHQASPTGPTTIAPVTGYAIKLADPLDNVINKLNGGMQ